MHPRLTISALFMTTSFAQALETPSDLFLPAPDFSDSMSMRFIHSDTITARIDQIPGVSHGTVKAVEAHGISFEERGTDSCFFHVEWDSRIPRFGRGLTDGATSYKSTWFAAGSEPVTDSAWSIWDPATRTLVRRLSENTMCAWMDSSVFDDHDRLIFQESCFEEDSNVEEDPVAPRMFSTYISIFQAWFESPTDTLPRRVTVRQGEYLVDSVVSFGPANRPDSLGGKGHVTLIRDAQGRITGLWFKSNTSDTMRFEYDASNRLIAEIKPNSEIRYAYSWSDRVGIRQTKISKDEHFQLVAGGLRLDLSAPEHVRVERISRDGKRLAVLADRNLPAGRTQLPISVKAGDLVRIESASRTTILVVPVR